MPLTYSPVGWVLSPVGESVSACKRAQSCLHAETSGHEGLTQVQKAKKGKPLTFWYGQSEITALQRCEKQAIKKGFWKCWILPLCIAHFNWPSCPFSVSAPAVSLPPGGSFLCQEGVLCVVLGWP